MALAALWPVPASAAARQREAALHVALVSHDKHISQRELRLAARALTNQVNQDLRTWWPGAPVLVTVAQSAGHSRWRLTVEALTINADVSGKHGQNRHGVWGTIYPSSGVPWTWSTSHELLEMLEDPSGHVKSNGFQREICDPVDNIGYYIDNVVLSDFVTPAYFRPGPGARGPWDYLGQLTAPIYTPVRPPALLRMNPRPTPRRGLGRLAEQAAWMPGRPSGYGARRAG